MKIAAYFNVHGIKVSQPKKEVPNAIQPIPMELSESLKAYQKSYDDLMAHFKMIQDHDNGLIKQNYLANKK